MDITIISGDNGKFRKKRNLIPQSCGWILRIKTDFIVFTGNCC
jgi:hypothetical protein